MNVVTQVQAVLSLFFLGQSKYFLLIGIIQNSWICLCGLVGVGWLHVKCSSNGVIAVFIFSIGACTHTVDGN